MFYADTITKTFLTSTSRRGEGPSRVLDYQDPTYLSFRIRILYEDNNTSNYDLLPVGIFCAGGKNNQYSAIKYLYDRGEIVKAKYLEEFEYLFSEVVMRAPWYFTKISGLNELWKLEPNQNYRAKDKKITIETYESIDLKMNYIIDLYRKAVWDAKWARWNLPDFMRQFNINITISEIRNLKINEENNYNTMPGYVTTSYKLEERSPGMKISNWTNGTFISFNLRNCEIDIAEPGNFLDTSSSIEGPANNKFVLKVGNIEEINVYGLLGGVLEEVYLYLDYLKNNLYFPSKFAEENSDKIPYNKILEHWLPPDYEASDILYDTSRSPAFIGNILDKEYTLETSPTYNRIIDPKNVYDRKNFFRNIPYLNELERNLRQSGIIKNLVSDINNNIFSGIKNFIKSGGDIKKLENINFKDSLRKFEIKSTNIFESQKDIQKSKIAGDATGKIKDFTKKQINPISKNIFGK